MPELFHKSDRYGDRLNSYDLLKLLALLTMVVDHAGYYLFPWTPWMRAVGRMAFPLFLFLVGYSRSWKLRTDLLLWAGLVAVCAPLTWHAVFPLNILMTIAFVRCAMGRLAPHLANGVILVVVFVCAIIWFPVFYWTDYSTAALLFAVAGYLQRERPDSMTATLFLLGAMLVHFGWEQSSVFHFTGISLFLMLAAVIIDFGILYRFRLRETDSPKLPSAIRRALQWAARNTLPLYGLHVMLLMIAERLLFPGRLVGFRWFEF